MCATIRLSETIVTFMVRSSSENTNLSTIYHDHRQNAPKYTHVTGNWTQADKCFDCDKQPVNPSESLSVIYSGCCPFRDCRACVNLPTSSFELMKAGDVTVGPRGGVGCNASAALFSCVQQTGLKQPSGRVHEKYLRFDDKTRVL